MRRTSELEGKSAVDLLEEALRLLRRLPFLSWAGYYLGTLPYTFVFLLYLLNIAHNPDAAGQLVGYSALLALLYLWLRFWQSAFAAEIWRLRSGDRLVTWNASSVSRILRNHLRYSPLSLLALALSPLLAFPLPWAYALHNNLVLLVLPGLAPDGRTVRQSWRQARLWPGQNHLVVLLLALISLFAFINFASCLFFVPYLVKLLTGLESTFTRLGSRLLDLKMLLAAVALTYLAVSPLVRVIYVLRCFYGISLQTGADLLSELRRGKTAAIVLAAFFLVAVAQAGPADNAENTSRSALHGGPVVSESSLDESIAAVLQNRKHLWQAPRNARKGEEPGFLKDFGQAVERWLNKVAHWLAQVLRWLRPEHPQQPKASTGGKFEVRQFAIVLLVGCSLALVLMLARTLLQRRSRSLLPRSPRVAAPLDLRRADLSPEELPEEKWLDLATDMMEQGQPRLAVRAVYLAGVVVLGKRDLLTPTRFKSNRDYLREVRRRCRGTESLIAGFEAMVRVFEKVWYGQHETGRADVEEMRRLLGELSS